MKPAAPRPVRVADAVFAMAARALPHDVRIGFAADVREAFHDDAAEAYRQGGMPRLVRVSVSALADIAATRHDRSRPRKGQLMQTLAQDLRYACRTFLRQPGFTLGALLILALAIGGNTAIFSLVNAALLRPLPYPDPDRLVRVWGARPDLGEIDNNVNPNDAHDWMRGSPGIEALGVYVTTTQPLTGAGDPVMLPIALVSSGFLETLQVSPVLGRGVSAEHDVPGRDNEVVITDGFWRRAFAGDPHVIGRSLRLADAVCTIIGVLPPRFVSPGTPAGVEPQLLRPLIVNPDNRGGHFARAIARLKPGASPTEVQDQVNRVAERLSSEFPSTNLGQRARLERLRDAIAGETRPAVLLLMAAVSLVLLIACANVANLLLARTAARRSEFAIRGALGASRSRVARQVLTESALLAVLASAAGVAAGILSMSALPLWLADQLPTVLAVGIDGRVLTFSVLISMATIVLSGVAPAILASRHDLRGPLVASAPGSGGGVRRFQSVLVVLESALALVLLVASTFLIQSLVRLQSVDPGFTMASTLTFRLTLPTTRYPDAGRRRTFFTDLISRLSAHPDVAAVGAVNTSPLSGRASCDSFGLGDRPAPPEGQEPCAEVRVATPGYFTAMGIPLLLGRAISDADHADAPLVAVISASMARRYWGEGSPVGKQFKWGSVSAGTPWLTIVGVIGNVKHFGLDEEPPDEVYMPAAQRAASAMTFAARLRGEDARVVSDHVRALVRELDPTLPVAEVFTTGELLSRSIAWPRFRTQLLTAFAAVALLLAVAGVYAVMAFHVAQRRREIGVRLALGATAGEVRRLFVLRASKMVGLGCAIGVAAAFLVVGVLRGVLFGTALHEPLPYILAPVVLLTTAVLASYLPARRATSVDPVETIRSL